MSLGVLMYYYLHFEGCDCCGEATNDVTILKLHKAMHQHQKTPPSSFAGFRLSSVVQSHVTELPLNVTGVLNSLSSLMIGPSNRSIALRAACSLHRHTAFSDRERMSILTPVPMPGTTELSLHGSNNHSHLTLVTSLAEKTANVINFSHYTDCLAREGDA
jgi:hypothetical protein